MPSTNGLISLSLQQRNNPNLSPDGCCCAPFTGPSVNHPPAGHQMPSMQPDDGLCELQAPLCLWLRVQKGGTLDPASFPPLPFSLSHLGGGPLLQPRVEMAVLAGSHAALLESGWTPTCLLGKAPLTWDPPVPRYVPVTSCGKTVGEGLAEPCRKNAGSPTCGLLPSFRTPHTPWKAALPPRAPLSP